MVNKHIRLDISFWSLMILSNLEQGRISIVYFVMALAVFVISIYTEEE